MALVFDAVGTDIDDPTGLVDDFAVDVDDTALNQLVAAPTRGDATAREEAIKSHLL